MTDPPLPPVPADALPGTLQKLLVMRSRDDRGYAVHHPLDAAEDPRGNGPASNWLPWHGAAPMLRGLSRAGAPDSVRSSR